MSNYEEVKGYGDTITCDNCFDLAEDWYSNGEHAICGDCVSKEKTGVSNG